MKLHTGVPSFDGVPQVGHDARRVGEGGADEAARQEAADQEGAKVGSEGAQEVEEYIAREGDVEDEAPAEMLRQGCSDERAAAVAEQEEGNRQTGGFQRDVEVV